MEKQRNPRSQFAGWKGVASPQSARKGSPLGIYHQMSPTEKPQENGYCRTTQVNFYFMKHFKLLYISDCRGVRDIVFELVYCYMYVGCRVSV